MADLGTMTGSTAPNGATTTVTGSSAGPPGRTVRRMRGLPRGRAVVGALLIAGAAVAVFAAYLDAQGEPEVSYLVADRPIDPGTRFADRDEVLDALTGAPIDLMPELAARAIPVDEVDLLVGWLVVTPLERGDLLTRSVVVPDGDVAGSQTMSFSLPRAAAVGGSLRVGEHIDVLATYGSGEGASTSFVVRGVPLLQVAAQDGGALGGSGDVILTVAISSLTEVQALGHAVNTASVFVTRSSASDGDGSTAPGPYTTDAGEGSTGSDEPDPETGAAS